MTAASILKRCPKNNLILCIKTEPLSWSARLLNGDLNIFETVLYSAVVAQKAPQAKDQGSQQLCSNIDIYPEKKSEKKKYRFIYNNFDHVRPIYCT